MGIAFGGDIFIQNMIECAKLAEQKKLDSVWATDYAFYREPFSPLAAFALVTEKVRLGTGVVNPYTRHPVILAQTIAGIDELSKGRAILGLSSGVKGWVEDQMGVKQTTPLQAIRETVEIIRELLKGRRVTHNGKVFRVRNVQLTFRPTRAEIPIYLGAVGAKMLQLAGDIGDGVFFSSGTPVEFIKYAKQEIEIGAKREGKNLSRFDVTCLKAFSVSDDPEISLEIMRPYVAWHLSIRETDMFSTLGKVRAEEKRSIRERWLKGDHKGAIELVTDSMVNKFTIAGSPEDCVKGIERFFDAGVDTMVLMPSGPDLNKAVRAAIDVAGKVAGTS